MARPLVGSLVHECVRKEHDLDAYTGLPDGGLTGFDDAVRRAMRGARPSTGPRNLAVACAAVTATAMIGSAATDPDGRWYRGLDLPPWQPPKAAFPIVWTALFAAIAGVSASAVTTFEDAQRPGEAERFRLAFVGNLVLNAGWSLLFFGAHRPALAALEGVALTASAIDLDRRAAQAGPLHAKVLAAYPAWCAFAAVLTADIARRNRRR